MWKVSHTCMCEKCMNVHRRTDRQVDRQTDTCTRTCKPWHILDGLHLGLLLIRIYLSFSFKTSNDSPWKSFVFLAFTKSISMVPSVVKGVSDQCDDVALICHMLIYETLMLEASQTLFYLILITLRLRETRSATSIHKQESLSFRHQEVNHSMLLPAGRDTYNKSGPKCTSWNSSPDLSKNTKVP